MQYESLPKLIILRTLLFSLPDHSWLSLPHNIRKAVMTHGVCGPCVALYVCIHRLSGGAKILFGKHDFQSFLKIMVQEHRYYLGHITFIAIHRLWFKILNFCSTLIMIYNYETWAFSFHLSWCNASLMHRCDLGTLH